MKTTTRSKFYDIRYAELLDAENMTLYVHPGDLDSRLQDGLRRRAKRDGLGLSVTINDDERLGTAQYVVSLFPKGERGPGRKKYIERLKVSRPRPAILIYVEGGNVQCVSGTKDVAVDVHVFDMDVIKSCDDDEVKRYLRDRLDLFTPKSREIAEYFIASPEAFQESDRSLRELEIDEKKFPQALY